MKLKLKKKGNWQTTVTFLGKVLKYLILSIMFVFFLMYISRCSKELVAEKKEREREEAYEFIEKCENPYTWWGVNVNGKTCDDARKTYYQYTEEEWEEAKRDLIYFGEITEKDSLYDKIKKGT
ncbi:hypothetical protein ACIQXV_24650 [Neobacillus sp. NPDC097160]|uniref:hypothetical protein n=1 Tax=Neobacillus sp. NPDC097160 TaxID=3364298 RepID=UPI003804F52C